MIATVLSNAVLRRRFEGKSRFEFRLLCLSAPQIARSASPGQFVQVKVNSGPSPLLRRPFAVFDAERDNVYLYYAVSPTVKEVAEYRRRKLPMPPFGSGTPIMADWKRGDKVDIIGPLGRGFKVPRGKRVVLVAGGNGIAAIHYLAGKLLEVGKEVVLLAGARTSGELILPGIFSKGKIEVRISTDDGTRSIKGFASQLLSQYINENPESAAVCACGPEEMLKAVARICAEKGLSCQVSLHTRMGCGFGACLGCSIPARDFQTGKVRNAKTCTEGPVFDARAFAGIWYQIGEKYGISGRGSDNE
jgi:dihydroorotate dehydrogenase electron transfer subunit